MKRIYVMDRDCRAFGMYLVEGNGKVFFNGNERRIPNQDSYLQRRRFTDEELDARIKALNLTKMKRCAFLKYRRKYGLPTEGW